LIQEIIKKYETQSIKSIAKSYNLPTKTISNILKENNIPVIPLKNKYDHLRKIPITNIQKEFIFGTLLGDSCLYKDNVNYRLSFGHCKKQQEYFNWKVNILSPFIKNIKEYNDKRGNSVMLKTYTISHPDLNDIASLFYIKNKKIVPDNLTLTPISLAALIQDDGSLNKVNMRLSSMGFSKEDNEKLKNHIYKSFNLICDVKEFKYKSKLYYHLIFNKDNTYQLSNIIKPYVVDSMKYKLLNL